MTKNSTTTKWIIPIVIIVIVIFVLVTGYLIKVHRYKKTEFNGYPVYYDGIYAASDDLWIKRAKQIGMPREYNLYRLLESGEEKFVQAFPGTASFWNKDKEEFYYLSENILHGFNPKTGADQIFSLEEKYSGIVGLNDTDVFLQQKTYGRITKYSTDDFTEYILTADGVLLGIYDEYLLTWNVFKKTLSCFRYTVDKLIWCVDFSSEFNSIPVVGEYNDTIFIGNRHGSNLYSIPHYSESSILKKFNVYGTILGMINAGEYLIIALSDKDSIGFYALNSDNSIIKLSTWNEIGFYQDSPLIMDVFGRRLYAVIKSEETIFSFDLP